MSHFTVAVFTKNKPNEVDLDEILNPYCEDPDLCGYERCEFEEDDCCDPDEEGRCGYWHNPSAKWDWWDIGGRWTGMLETKSGEKVDSGFCKNLLFKPDESLYEYHCKQWRVDVNGEKIEDVIPFRKAEWYIERYGTMENYARKESEFGTFAFIDESGDWHEKGQMGWFGYDSSTPDSLRDYDEAFKAYLNHAIQENLCITIVDCHI